MAGCEPLLEKFRDVLNTVQPHTPDAIDEDCMPVTDYAAISIHPAPAATSAPAARPVMHALPAPPAVAPQTPRITWPWICGACVMASLLVALIIILIMTRQPARRPQRRRKFKPPTDLSDEGEDYEDEDVYDDDPSVFHAEPPASARRVPTMRREPGGPPSQRLAEQDDRPIGVEDDEDPMFQPLQRAGVAQ